VEVDCLAVTRGSVAGQQAMCVSHDTRVSTAHRLYSDFVLACSPFRSIYPTQKWSYYSMAGEVVEISAECVAEH
jgi:hypothetical protein